MENNILPIFKSHYSIGKSILNCDKAEEIDENKPVSIFSIAKHYGLKEIYVSENSMTGFIENWENSKDINIPLRFGLQLYVCADSTNKSDKSRDTESKITIWLKNSNGYKSLIKISSKSATDNFYYHPRLSWTNLKNMWDDNLSLSIDFYDGFIGKNLLKHKSRCVPDFGPIKPIFFIEPLHELPFDDLITEATLNYCKNSNYDLINTHTCFYYLERDVKQYLVFRCINERTTVNKPNISFFSSNKFAFETWLKNKNND